MVDTHKHLGIFLTSNLDWSVHLNETYLKAIQNKIAILRSVKLLSRHLIYKLTVTSVVDCVLTVYFKKKTFERNKTINKNMHVKT